MSCCWLFSYIPIMSAYVVLNSGFAVHSHQAFFETVPKRFPGLPPTSQWITIAPSFLGMGMHWESEWDMAVWQLLFCTIVAATDFFMPAAVLLRVNNMHTVQKTACLRQQ